MREANCDVIRDLLPVYIDGLASEATKELVDAHVASCADCRAALETMRAPEPERTADDQKELDFLEKTRRKNRRSLVWAAVSVLVLALAAFAVRFYVMGTVSRPDSLLCDVSVADTTLALKASPIDSAGAVGRVQFEEADGVITVSTRTVLTSPLHRGSVTQSYNAKQPIRQVIVNDRIVWDDGVSIPAYASRLYATRHKYIGSASENAATAYVLLMGPTRHSLDTDARPYTWHIELWETKHEQSEGLDDFTEAELQMLASNMRSAAYAMLALVENLDQVSFDCLCEGAPYSLVVTAEDATEFFGRDIKDCYDSPRLFAALLQKAGLSGYVTLGRSALDITDRTVTIINGTDLSLRSMSLAFQNVFGDVTSSVAGQNADGSALGYGDSLSFFDVPGFMLPDETLLLSLTTMDGDVILIDQPISLTSDQRLTLRGSADTGFTLEP